MASFKSDCVHFHWNIRLLPATQADSHAGSKVYIWNVFGFDRATVIEGLRFNSRQGISGGLFAKTVDEDSEYFLP